MAKSGLLGTLSNFNRDPLGTIAGDPAPVSLSNNPEDFQPKTPTVLGALADAFLQSRGLAPAYANARNERNLQDAMQGFTTSPLAAIQRLGKIPGQEANAFKLFEQYQDDKRADLQTQYLEETRKEHFRDRVASMLGAVTPDNASVLLPKIKNYANAMGLGSDDVPDTYDPNAINMYRMGGISVDQQQDNALNEAYKEKRLEQMDRTIGNTESYRNTRISQIASGQAEQERHNRAMENKPPSARKPEGRYVMTKYGPGQVSASGKTMTVKIGNIVHVYANTGPNNWRKVDTMQINSSGKLVPIQDSGDDE